MPHETLIGVFDRVRWRSPEGDYVIGYLESKQAVQGPVPDEDALVPGITYEFYGKWTEHPDHGPSFRFTLFTTKVPHSRHGIVAYLMKYARGVGTVVAGKLWDAFGADAVKILRTEPAKAVSVPEVGRWLSLEKAEQAAAVLQSIADLEDTKIGLTNLFAGRGFPAILVEECVERWRILAPQRIQRDPYTLLVHGMSGCGFARCDRLYTDLGLPPGRLKRQVICLWHALHSDSSGHTWVKATVALERMAQLVSGAELKPKKAILLGCRARWLARRRDEGGVLWLAEGERARHEAHVARKLSELSAWQPPTEELAALVHLNSEVMAPMEAVA